MKILLQKIIGIAFIITTSTVFSGELTVPNTFTSGTAAVAAEVNENFQTIADGVNTNDAALVGKQNAISSVCDAGMFMTGVGVDGSPNCATDQVGTNNIGDITAVTAGEGLVGSATSGPVTLEADFTSVQKRISETGCAFGSAIRKVNENGTVSCQQITSPATSFPGTATKTANFSFHKPSNYGNNTIITVDVFFLGCHGSTYRVGIDAVSHTVGTQYYRSGLTCVNCDSYSYQNVTVASVPSVSFPSYYYRYSKATFIIDSAEIRDLMTFNIKRAGADTADTCNSSLAYHGSRIAYTNTDLGTESVSIPVSATNF